LRLQKALAQAGIASRRASERLIQEGRVRVNGRVITEMGVQVDLDRDAITVDGRSIRVPVRRRYVKLYKPVGTLCVLHDEHGRSALSDIVPDSQGLHPVGRLDLDSEGLVILTDDGALTFRLTHPRYEHPKEYLVLVEGHPTQESLRDLRRGIVLEDGRTAPAQVEFVERVRWGQASEVQSWLRFVIHEGRKRQIRRMCDAVGCPVYRLIRVRVGPISLSNLDPGEWKPLTEGELERLFKVLGLPERATFS
jgi:23S rRNA pseudouridine2605 synthase